MLSLAVAATATAQPGGPGPEGGGRPGGAMRGGMGRGGSASPVGATADFLLAHTGDLALTDAQVVRLAAISRRTEARRTAMAARMDSARAAGRPAPGDSAAGAPGARATPNGPSPAERQRMRNQMRADVRDAIAVLTVDQQATAWMMTAGGGPLGGMPVGPGGGPGREDADGGPPDRGAISRPPAPRDVPRRPDDANQPTP